MTDNRCTGSAAEGLTVPVAGSDGGNDDDAALIERSVVDPEAFGALFDRHGPRIHRYLAGRLGRDAADDLLAETFVAAFRRRSSPSKPPYCISFSSAVTVIILEAP